jgi:DNA-binding NarL/FixJ family response regulator
MIRIIAVTDVYLLREGLARLLGDYSDIAVIATATPDEEAFARALEPRPEIVLIDATSVRNSEPLRLMLNKLDSARLVAFAVAEENEEEVLACAEAGVAGYVGRGATANELVEIIRSVARGEVRCSSVVATVALRQLARTAALPDGRSDLAGLTDRELEVVALIESGLSNKAIARRLAIEVATVKNHVHNILEKLHVGRRGEAAAYLRNHDVHSSPGALSDSGADSASSNQSAKVPRRWRRPPRGIE